MLRDTIPSPAKQLPRADMKAFLALHMMMELVEKAEIEDYWETFWLTSTSGFSRIMS